MSKNKQIHLNLRALRHRILISGRDLASLTGLAPKLIFDLENGRGNPRLSTLEKIALGLSLELSQPPRETIKQLLDQQDFDKLADVFQRSQKHLHEPTRVRRFRPR